MFSDLGATIRELAAHVDAFDRRDLAQRILGPPLCFLNRGVALTDRNQHLHSWVFWPLGPSQECSGPGPHG